MNARPHSAARRLFLRQAGAISALTGAGAPTILNLLAAGAASAQSAGDYRAVVCLFLQGGNDSFNTVLATDAPSWSSYTAVRSQAPDPIALLAPGTAPVVGATNGTQQQLGGVLPIAPARAQGRSFALHPNLAALQTLFDGDKRLAIVPNVGPLVMPLTKAQYAQAASAKPKRLFSHSDQTSAWQCPSQDNASLGWGGRLADMLAGGNTQTMFSSISTGGSAAWLSGQSARQYQIGGSGPVRLGVDSAAKLYGSATAGAALQRITSTSFGSHAFESDMAAVARRSIDAEALLRTALRPASEAPFGTMPSSGSYDATKDPKLKLSLYGGSSFNALAQRFQTIARMVDAGMRGATGVRRQVFFVNMGNFDTHDDQSVRQADLLARVAQGLAYFDATLGALGARNAVTTFTASEFGRSFISNGDGTDHGWGGHHFVLGGAVKGGDLYGSFPALGPKNATNGNFDSSPNQLANGVLLPGTSVDQLGATLARWFGVTDSQVLDVFPNLRNFDASQRDLGFMNA